MKWTVMGIISYVLGVVSFIVMVASTPSDIVGFTQEEISHYVLVSIADSIISGTLFIVGTVFLCTGGITKLLSK